MSNCFRNAAFPLLSTGLFILTLSGCESTGSYRVASVVAQGPQGAQGERGAQGFQGTSGSNGLGGANGLAGTNAVATGGLVGPGGVAGTGLLANTGDPSRPGAGSGVLVASGTAASNIAQRGTPLSERVDGATPGGLTLTGRVIQTANSAGQALVQAGNGQQYLVDGVTASPGQLVTVNVQDQRVIGQNGNQPLIAGTAVAASTQQRGDALTLGAGNRDTPLTVGSSATGTVVPGATPSPTPTANVVQQVTGALPVIPRGN